MRVIAGAAGGTPLVAPPGLTTRPTSDLMRGVIFNMLAPEGPFARVADFYAGSGALGIEALSRGAEFAAFIEQNARACRIIQRNLQAAKVTEQSRIICATLPGAIDRLPGCFDLVLLDPPFQAGDLPNVIRKLEQSGHLAPEALVAAEHRATTVLPDRIGKLAVWKRRRQGDAAVTFYRHEPMAAPMP